MALFLLVFSGEKFDQTFRKMNSVVANLLQAARGKDEMQVVLFVTGAMLVAVEFTQNIIAISIHRCAARGGAARQDQIQPCK